MKNANNDELFNNKYRIETARSQKIDYDSGEFFITFCTQYRKNYLGIIENNIMFKSCTGTFIEHQIINIKNKYPYINIINYVIMPNHVHILLTIDGKYRRHNIDRTIENKSYQEISLCKSNLSIAIGRIKEQTTKFAKRHDITFAWQTRFYEKKIFDNNLHCVVNNYITNNVINWKEDRFHPDNDNIDHM
ncbi:MAG: hypothetical protein MJZ66_08685 [Bacteroidales bacterium]|nr:hypothetical protein [Bacteroidales bacterium]